MIFDSLSNNSSRSGKAVATLREYLAEEYSAKHNGAQRSFPNTIMKGSLIRVPQQPNFTDCGLFILHYFQYFFGVSSNVV